MVTEQKTKETTSNPSDPHDEGAKLGRIAGHTRGLVEDLTDWFELKMQFVVLDLQDQAWGKVKGFAYEGLAIVILGIAIVFAFVALALGLAEWLSHPAWGFLAVTGLLALLSYLVRFLGKRAGRSIAPEDEPLTYRIPEPRHELAEKRPPELSAEQNGKD